MTTMRKKNISRSTFYVRELSDQTDATYGVYMDGVLLTTPAGNPVTAKNPRGLRLVAAELDFADVLDVSGINLYGMYSTEKEFVVAGRSCMGDELLCALASDALLTLCSGPEARYQWAYYSPVVEFLDANGLKHPCYTQMPLPNGRRDMWSEDAWEANVQGIADFVDSQLLLFTPPQSSAFLTAMTFLDSPIIALMLVQGKASPKEVACLYLLANCIYSKGFSDIWHSDEKKALESITKNAECVRTYVELFR
jgi:chaperone required for assembly of F1-ATPase